MRSPEWRSVGKRGGILTAAALNADLRVAAMDFHAVDPSRAPRGRDDPGRRLRRALPGGADTAVPRGVAGVRHEPGVHMDAGRRSLVPPLDGRDRGDD